MSEAGRAWRLVRGDELLAELVVTGGDFPWLNAEVRPAAGLAEVRPLFDDELSGSWNFSTRTLNRGRPPTAASVRQYASWHPTGGQCRSSCSTSRAATPGGDGAMSPSRKHMRSKASKQDPRAGTADLLCVLKGE
jgi:hypothetical protein